MASPNGEALLSLVRKAQKDCELFVILGDLFDIWVGEGRAFQNEYAPLIAEFRKLRDSCDLIYFEGNHDLHLTKFWKDEMGFAVFTEPQDLNFHGLRIRAEHGDEINRDDRGYLFLRWFLRTGPIKFLAESLPSRFVFKVGSTASHASREYTSTLQNKSQMIFRTYAQNLRTERDFDLLLTGHTHIADDFSFITSKGSGRLINLGSWFDGPHYLEIDEDLKISNRRLPDPGQE